MKNILILLISTLVLSLSKSYGQKTIKTDTFSFRFEGKKLRGVVDLPINQPAKSIIILVPGDGKSNIKWFSDIRTHFAESGIACCIWDKMGCGESEGEYHQQSVENSASEVLSALQEIKRRKIKGADKIGLWGISRAGWICPLVINKFPISYWISVSGTDDKENFVYMMESNFRIAGKSTQETQLLISEWKKGFEIFRNGGSYEDCVNARLHLWKDTFYVANFGVKPSKEDYIKGQQAFMKEHHSFDEKTGLMIYIPNFENILKNISCPVLAIFGEKDSNVDWKKTLALYKNTIGSNKKATLAIKTFPDGNHGILKCKTGAVNEKMDDWEPCDGYFETMTTWLKQNEK